MIIVHHFSCDRDTEKRRSGLTSQNRQLQRDTGSYHWHKNLTQNKTAMFVALLDKNCYRRNGVSVSSRNPIV